MMKPRLLIFLACGLSLSIFSQALSPKEKKIKKLLELTGSGKLGVQVAKSMIASFKKSYTNVSQETWDEISKEINAEDLIDLVVPIYDKYYTDKDIDLLIAFYDSPIGKKSIAVTPALTEECMAAGQGWGRMIGEKVAKKLKEKGYADK